MVWVPMGGPKPSECLPRTRQLDLSVLRAPLLLGTKDADSQCMIAAPRLGSVVAHRRSSPFVVGSMIAGAASTLFLLWMVLVIGGARTTDAVDDVGELIAALVAAVLCAIAASRAPAHRKSWALLGLSSFAWAVGEGFWTYYDLIEKIQVPFPSLADVGFVTAIPFMIAGLLLFPQPSGRAAHRFEGLLDGCIIAMSLLFASWATILGPIYRSHQGGELKQILSLTYPMSDVVMISLVIILIARAGQQRRVGLGLVMVGVVAFAVADSRMAAALR